MYEPLDIKPDVDSSCLDVKPPVQLLWKDFKKEEIDEQNPNYGLAHETKPIISKVHNWCQANSLLIRNFKPSPFNDDLCLNDFKDKNIKIMQDSMRNQGSPLVTDGLKDVRVEMVEAHALLLDSSIWSSHSLPDDVDITKPLVVKNRVPYCIIPKGIPIDHQYCFKRRGADSGTKKYPCNECGRYCKSKYQLKIHKLVHSNEKPFKCDICGIGHKRKYELQRHIRRHSTGRIPKVGTSIGHHILNTKEKPDSGTKKYPCEKCGKIFTRKYQVKLHKVVHSTERPFKCDVCVSQFKRIYDLKAHIKKMHFTDKCSKVSSSVDDRYNVETKEKSDSAAKMYPCYKCGKTFKRKFQVRLHMVVHSTERPFKCDVCGSQFKRNDDLKTHIKKMHLTDKCPKASSSVDDRYNVETKEKSDSADKMYPCDKCGRCFKWKFQASIHKLMHSTEKPFKCDICGIRYKKKHSLKVHFMKSHLGMLNNLGGKDGTLQELNLIMKKFDCILKCDLCGKGFSYKKSLQSHLRFHLECSLVENKNFCSKLSQDKSLDKTRLEDNSLDKTRLEDKSLDKTRLEAQLVENRRYQCELCSWKFKSNSKLKMHMVTHSSNRPFTCKQCFISFKRLDDLYSHQKVHSNQKQFQCHKCHLRFKRSNELKRHFKFGCEQQRLRLNARRKATVEGQTLLKYLLSNLGDKPYLCDTCGKRFLQKREVESHVQSHVSKNDRGRQKRQGYHLHNRDCDRKDTALMKRHKLNRQACSGNKTNSSTQPFVEKPWRCEICGKGFLARRLLIRHFLSHSSLKPFKCDMCNAKFPYLDSLHRHILIHLGLKDICNTSKGHFYSKEFSISSWCNLQLHTIAHSRLEICE